MKLAAIVVLCLFVPVVALAGNPNPTCDACIDIDDAISPTPEWQTVAGSTVGTPNGEYTYAFCAVGGEAYTFSTCDGTSPGGANYDTALSVWEILDGACGANLECNDDNCSGGSSGLLSTVTFVAPADGEYLIVVDGFSSGEGDYTLAYMGAECQSTPTDEVTWGKIKSDYR